MGGGEAGEPCEDAMQYLFLSIWNRFDDDALSVDVVLKRP